MTIFGATTEDFPLFDVPRRYDAVLVMSFGGPEGMNDVMPFLENVTRGRNVPRERLAEVAHHYERFGGVSPLNEQNRKLVAALEAELRSAGLRLPVYFGNRNWHPFVTDTVRRMRDDGVRRAIAVVTTAFSCYPGRRRDPEDILPAAEPAGEDAPGFAKGPAVYNHPRVTEPCADD